MKDREKCRVIQRLYREKLNQLEVRDLENSLRTADYSVEELRSKIDMWRKREAAVAAKERLDELTEALEYRESLEFDAALALVESDIDWLRDERCKQRAVVERAIATAKAAESAVPAAAVATAEVLPLN